MKSILFTLTVLCCSVEAIACDACGCSGSLGNMGLGIQAHGNRTSFSLVHSFKTYHTVVRGLYGHSDQQSYEYYNKTELTGSFRLSHRFQAKAAIPLVTNNQFNKTEATRIAESGLGDVQVALSYFVIDSAYSMNKLVRWSVGLGSKLPTGRFVDPESEFLMLSPGTGTFDYLAISSFAFRSGRYAISNESSFALRTTNKYDYHPGNTWYNQTIGLLIFNRFSVGTGISVTANGIAKYQGEDYNHTNAQAILVQEASVVAFSSNGWSFQLGVNLPLYQQLGEGNSNQRGAVSFGIYHLLKQKQ